MDSCKEFPSTKKMQSEIKRSRKGGGAKRKHIL